MHERSFIVLIDKDYDESLQQMALLAAQELFCVEAEYDSSEDLCLGENCVKKPRWVIVKGKRVERLDNAKEYLTACFTPESRCTELICEKMVQILQDGNAFWWQSIECEFKVRVIWPDEGELDQMDPPMIVRGHPMIKLIVQGNEVPVSYASSFLAELNSNFISPPLIDEPIDEEEVRRSFKEVLSNWIIFDRDLYSKCNAYALKLLLKWFYFIKGAQPANPEYVLNLKPKNDNSVIVLAGDVDLIGLDFENEAETALDEPKVEVEKEEPEPETDMATFFTKRPPPRNDTKLGTLSENVEVVSSSEDDATATSKSLHCLETSPTNLSPIEDNGPWSEQILRDIAIEHEKLKAAQTSLSASVEPNNIAASSAPVQSFDPMKIVAIQQTTRRQANRRKMEDTTKLQPLSEVEFQMLRPIILDGSNIAMQHSTRPGAYRSRIFSSRAILIACRYFIARGHYVIAFVPEDRARQHPENPRKMMTDKHMLLWMIDKNLICQTPAQRSFNAKQEYVSYIKCYDDLMLIQYADNHAGVIVSKDQYRDVLSEYPEWEGTIQNRRLMFTWVGDEFMVPQDPMGRGGTSLSNLLRFAPNEIAPTASRVMDERTCRELLHEIDEQLARPAPPVDPFVPHAQWNGHFNNYNNNRPYYNRQNNWGFNRQFRNDEDIAGSSEQALPEARPDRVEEPAQAPLIQWNVFPARNSGSSIVQKGSFSNGPPRSPPSYNQQYNGGYNQYPNRQQDPSVSLEKAARATMFSKLSQVFDRASISKAIKRHPDVKDAQRMGELITDMMLAGEITPE